MGAATEEGATHQQSEQTTRCVTVQDAQRSVRVTIPKPVADALDVDPGDQLVIRAADSETAVVKTSESIWKGCPHG